jgi:hypothetical protein
LHHFFPSLFQELEQIEDFREKSQYAIGETLFAAIAMHIFKSGSRNNFNNLRKERSFALNYFKAFKMSLPHMDTVDLIMRVIPNNVLEKLKTHLVKGLIEKKIFYKYKIFGEFFNVSVDGTGVMTISDKNTNHFKNALFRVYNKGEKNEFNRYFINVLEAKLVCSNGFCISLATEWIENPEGKEEYKKQDCELKAFVRIAEKLKSNFPRLPICIVGDGLYPNQNVFSICQKYRWEWIFTLKDGTLPSIWEEVNLKTIQEEIFYKEEVTDRLMKDKENNNEVILKKVLQSYSWIKNIDYKGHVTQWVSLTEVFDGEVLHEFIYLTSLRPTHRTIVEIIQNGRLRFKIENEGFNTQKNQGYSLQHKYSETSDLATKNYYTCLQISHMINQLFELSTKVKEATAGRDTVQNLWEFIRSVFSIIDLAEDELKQSAMKRLHVKFV